MLEEEVFLRFKMFSHKGNRENKIRKNAGDKKRKFNGNRFSAEQSTEATCLSAKKLKNSDNLQAKYDTTVDYVFLAFTNFFLTLSMHVKCNKCNSDITFCKTCVKGLGFQVLLECQCPTNIARGGPLGAQFNVCQCALKSAPVGIPLNNPH